MIKELLIKALGETIYMVVYSTIFSLILGSILAIILIVTHEDGLKPNKIIYRILDLIINVLRSFPFIILMIAIMPFTRIIVGKTIGKAAAVVPLTIAAAPFVARVIESSLREVDKGLIEAAKSFGATTTQILFKVMIKEAFPSIMRGIVLTVINLIGYTAMAGAVGAGGLGDVAMQYGYNRFKTDIMIYTVLVLILLVQLVQSFGNVIYNKLNK